MASQEDLDRARRTLGIAPMASVADAEPSVGTWDRVVDIAGGTLTGKYSSDAEILANKKAEAERFAVERANTIAASGGEAAPSADKKYTEADFAGLSAGGQSSTEGGKNDVYGAMASTALDTSMMGGSGGQKAAPAYFEPEGVSYTTFGGVEGKKLFNKAFVEDPRDMEAAMVASEEAKQARSKEHAAVYDAENTRRQGAMAATQASRLHDQQQIAQRQQELEEKTTYYTNDLADQGKFWTNPGNILAAISFAMLPAFGGDPTSGVKMINQAIDRDMANRQHAADQTLGALKSNLSGYHKLVGDKEAGNLLAEAEAHRLAAEEIGRISAKYESPISKAQSQAAITDQNQRSLLARMEAYSKMAHINASKMAIEQHNARAKGFDGSWESYTDQAKKLKPGAVAEAPAEVAMSRGSVPGTNGSPSVAASGFSSPVIAARFNADPKQAMRAMVEARAPGTSDLVLMQQRYLDIVTAKDAAKGPDAVNAAKSAMIEGWKEKDKPHIKELTDQSDDISRTSAIQARINLIKNSEAALNRDPARYLDSARPYLPSGWMDAYENYKVRTGGSAAPGSAEDYANKKNFAKQVLRRQVAALTNEYIKTNSGGNVTSNEEVRVKRVVHPDANLDEVESFIADKSAAAKRKESSALAGLSAYGALAYKLRMGSERGRQLDTSVREAPRSQEQAGMDKQSGRGYRAPAPSPEALPFTALPDWAKEVR